MAARLGEPLPPGDEHAVSVSLPTWRDTLGWAHRDARVLSHFKAGYPRFFVPHLVRDLAVKLVGWARQHRQPIPASGVSAMLFPSGIMAEACDGYLKKRCGCIEAFIGCLRVQFDGSIKSINGTPSTRPGDHVYMVLHPDSLGLEAKAFWQHTGFGISSRFAAFWLKHAPFLGGKQGPSASLPVADAQEAALALRQRIASLYSTEMNKVSVDDVFLYHTGMSAIAHAASALRRLSSHADKGYRFAVFGFPYVDTFKVLSKVHGFDCVLYGHASTSEMDALEAELQSGMRLDALVTEFPGNPLLRSLDLGRLVTLSRKYGFFVVIDDTIGTAVNLDIVSSCDIICTSLTKMFSGACNVMGGSTVLNPRSEHHRALRAALSDLHQDTYFPLDVIVMNQNSAGFESRVLMASRNAQRLVQRLRRHSIVDKVFYPWGSPTQHLYDCFKRPGGEYGYLLSIQFFEPAAAMAFFDALDVAKGPSLGTNFTLSCAYTLLAHASELDWAAKYGVSEHLVRISVGIEEQESLVALIDAALAAVESFGQPPEGRQKLENGEKRPF
ncbi:hypothetical protein XA68_17602 [Ophiocordyceps unilateralis]|uniref:Cystathionine gamma-synthase n=1 Tax=Ophiocordyceps unilateralis TaxID=268505 RepID=A0A2A9PKE4_OPHUN|nr:hypothetical protein XA68_17602 [Ophiocordyceps unilateralis]